MSRFWRSRPGRIGLITLLVFVALALAAPIIADRTGLDTSLARANDVPLYASPSEFGPLGTDHLRRSVWTQFVWGSRISLFVGLAATVITVALGSLVGIVAGFAGGRVEAVLMRVTEWFLVVPFLPLAIVLASVLGRSIWNII
ncbi:MAG: ABC transporter permease, partial [Acidimicrobiia bacterium]|nr:ABC transporter permease [Acidimicrobiia bacterium]